MADEALRELERAWRSAPQDGEAAARWVDALRRAGRPAPEAALDARLLPPRTIRTSVPIRVHGWRHGDPLDRPGGEARETELPEHSAWEALVALPRDDEATDRLAAELVAHGVERLWLDSRTSDARQLARFLRLLAPAPLTWLRLRLEGATPSALLDQALAWPGLVRLALPLDEGFGRLARARALEGLALTVGDDVPDRDLEALAALPVLTTLEVQGGGQARSGAFVGALPPRLRSLDLEGCARLDDAALLGVGRHRELTTLVLPDGAWRLTDAGLAPLAGLPLRSLSLGGPALGDQALAALTGLPLANLSLNAPRTTPGGWTALPTSIEELTLRGACPFDLVGLPRLRSLWLATNDPQGWLDVVPGAAGLEALDLCGPREAPEGVDVTPLALLPALRSLALRELRADPGALQDVGAPSPVRSVVLEGEMWGSEHVRALQGWPRLEELQLWFTGLSGDGVEALAGCASLRRLGLWHCGLSARAVERLRAARPDLKVTAS